MHDYNETRNEGPRRLQHLIGFSLIGLGVAGACWIASSLLTFITEPLSIPLVQTLSSATVPDRSLMVADQPVVLATTMLQATGMFLFLVVMGIAAGIVRTLVIGGVNLLQHDINRLLRNLKADIKLLGNSIRARSAAGQ